MPISKLHAAARAYAKAGWPVFPVCINAKNPACENGVHDATVDLKQIDEWWGAGDWNIGFCPEGAGMCVIDVDEGGCFADWSRRAPRVKSPHGEHFYYEGSLPPTASKIGPHIDTRGRNSYVLVPPSVVDGQTYVWMGDQPSEAWECPPIDSALADHCEASTTKPRKAKVHDEDRPQAIEAFKRYLERRPPPPEGEGSDDATYRALARGLDLGLSDDTIIQLIAGHSDYDPEWIGEKLDNVATYRQNELGCDTPETGQEKWGQFVQLLPDEGSESGVTEAERDAWTPHDPRDPKDMPSLDFYDLDRMIPQSPDGAIGILYGKRGDHKTNTVLSLLANTACDRILYAAGEGAYGVERDRISARSNLTGRIKILPRVPNFASPDQLASFIGGCRRIDFKPEICVLDTLATVLAGEDEQSAVTASYLTDNGPAGILKREWGCTLIFIAHAGKDIARGVRGSSGFEANVDFVLMCEADKDHRAIKLTCTKMRDGYDGHSTYWTYEPTGVPVPRQITEQDYLALVKPEVRESDETAPVGMKVKAILRNNKSTCWGNGMTYHELATAMTEYELGPRPGDIGDSDVAAWDTAWVRNDRALRNNKNAAWAKKCWDEQVERGSTQNKKMVLKWFVPPEDQEEM